ncbi:DNA-deoxyinosine glycosylase, partial [Acidovorax cattleyae]|nr:DNA-deoxyinosine glycosylase [Paracidovorax cattleyae]
GLPAGLQEGPVPSLRLPSTSPANASWSFERKRAAWAEALAPFGLMD